MDNQSFEHVGSLFVFASGHRVVLSSVGCFMYTDSLFMSRATCCLAQKTHPNCEKSHMAGSLVISITKTELNNFIHLV